MGQVDKTQTEGFNKRKTSQKDNSEDQGNLMIILRRRSVFVRHRSGGWKADRTVS